MKAKKLFVLSVFVLITFVSSAFAVEQIVRMSLVTYTMAGLEGSRPVALGTHGLEIPTLAVDPKMIFVVYTKDEIDAMRSQDIQAIRELREELASLRENLKSLSDINDALSKRLNSLEERGQ